MTDLIFEVGYVAGDFLKCNPHAVYPMQWIQRFTPKWQVLGLPIPVEWQLRSS